MIKIHKPYNMRNLLLLFLFLTSTTFAQSESPGSKTTTAALVNNFNKGTFDSIFAGFSPQMQGFLPAEKAGALFSTVKTEMGEITENQFLRYESGFALYKTTFKNGIRTLCIAIDADQKINGFTIKPFIQTMARNKTTLILPFKEEWKVLWGGDSAELNYHVVNEAQKNAFDLLIFDQMGKTHKADGKKNEDYYAFGKEIIAPCDAEVVLVVDGVKDNIPGEMNTFHTGGNTIVLKTVNDEYLYFCHFKHQSIAVKEGQHVKQGQLMGLCGNSGNSSEAHLHFHIQHKENVQGAVGIKAYFEKIRVNGVFRNDYSPLKGELIAN